MEYGKRYPEHQFAKDWFEYYPVYGTSFLKWKETASNRNPAGNIAGVIRPDGHYIVRLKGCSYRCSRIIWSMFHGQIPEGLEIDHKDGNPSNNMVSNLRPCTSSQNKANTKIRADNTSGIKGVDFLERLGKWRVRVGTNHYGLFDNLVEAVEKRNIVFLEQFGEFARSI